MRKSNRALTLLAAVAALTTAVITAQTEWHGDEQGFTDTPLLPGLPWHVHDPARPHPAVVTPAGRPGDAPSDAVILFNGSDLSNWTSARLGTAAYTAGNEPARWMTRAGYFEVAPGAGDIASREKFGDVQLHLEWMEPAGIGGTSQNRGNSGVFLMGLFEVQVLDSFDSRTYADGQAGALYGQWPPLVNASRPPGQWQTYDIIFEAPTFAGGDLMRPAFMTVFLNGVLIHNHREEMGPTIYRQVPKYQKAVSEGPLILQNHGAPVRYRNIWARRVGSYDRPEK